MNCTHYTDDGYSVGNFKRPAWKRLMNDIEDGRVNLVLAKDMSRIGRDYLQTGFYTEVFFRQQGVRFIAIANNVDSNDQNSNEFAPFLNIMKNYDLLPLFNGPYQYTEMSDLIQQYKDEGKSWKYTTVLLNPGEKEYVGSTVDGDGNEIKVYLRKNPEMMSIRQVAKRDGITEKGAYKKYGISIFQTTNAQTSIRTRVADFRVEQGITEDLMSDNEKYIAYTRALANLTVIHNLPTHVDQRRTYIIQGEDIETEE